MIDEEQKDAGDVGYRPIWNACCGIRKIVAGMTE